jgi:predicted nucleotidyltransferase component of viral defense system
MAQMFDPLYVQQAQLLVRCLPEIGRHACFALKGGTAINLFLRPMPRMSVDIDLTYLPLSTRDAALADMTRSLEDIAADLRRRIGGACVRFHRRVFRQEDRPSATWRRMAMMVASVAM